MSDDMQTGQVGQDNQAEASATVNSVDDTDYKSLYLEEVKNSKKLRKRAQETEGQLNEFNTQAESRKAKRLKEEGKKDEYIKVLEDKIASQEPKLQEAQLMIENRRKTLLERVSEDDRDRMAKLDIDTLEYVVSKVAVPKPTQIPTQQAGVRQDVQVDTSDFSKLEAKNFVGQEWDSIISKYQNKN